jgi:hypothetical protein
MYRYFLLPDLAYLPFFSRKSFDYFRKISES